VPANLIDFIANDKSRLQTTNKAAHIHILNMVTRASSRLLRGMWNKSHIQARLEFQSEQTFIRSEQMAEQAQLIQLSSEYHKPA